MGDIEQAILNRHRPPEWAAFCEMGNRTGYGCDSHIDAAAFNMWPSKNFERHAFEVKRSRSDFMREIGNPQKRQWVEENFHLTWFVTPAGLVKPDEIPEGWGLLELIKGGTLRRKKIGTYRKPPEISQDLCVAALRRMSEVVARERKRTFEFDGKKVTPDVLEGIVAERCSLENERLKRLRERLEKTRIRLDTATERFTGPLARLVEIAQGYNSSWKIEQDLEMPVLSVDALVDMAVEKKFSQLTVELKAARDALDKLVVR